MGTENKDGMSALFAEAVALDVRRREVIVGNGREEMIGQVEEKWWWWWWWCRGRDVTHKAWSDAALSTMTDAWRHSLNPARRVGGAVQRQCAHSSDGAG
jgi:hypothetical protein